MSRFTCITCIVGSQNGLLMQSIIEYPKAMRSLADAKDIRGWNEDEARQHQTQFPEHFLVQQHVF